MTIIIHLASNDAWLAVVGTAGLWRGKKGTYHANSLSTEGFIHCSTKSQIVGVANAFYHGQHGLVLLVIDPDKLTSELKWEPPAKPEPTHAREGELFPHIYGPINLDAVTNVIPFEPDTNGNFVLPELLL
jgi:uncharacterized protein (DUF952 family)